jgi:hypothetical protein
MSKNRISLIVPYTVWAADFKTPAGSKHFSLFIFFLGSMGRKKQKMQVGVSKSAAHTVFEKLF